MSYWKQDGSALRTWEGESMHYNKDVFIRAVPSGWVLTDCGRRTAALQSVTITDPAAPHVTSAAPVDDLRNDLARLQARIAELEAATKPPTKPPAPSVQQVADLIRKSEEGPANDSGFQSSADDVSPLSRDRAITTERAFRRVLPSWDGDWGMCVSPCGNWSAHLRDISNDPGYPVWQCEIEHTRTPVIRCVTGIAISENPDDAIWAAIENAHVHTRVMIDDEHGLIDALAPHDHHSTALPWARRRKPTGAP